MVSLNFVVRLIGMVGLLLAGWAIGSNIGSHVHDHGEIAVAGALLGMVAGLLLTPQLTVVPYAHLRRYSREAASGEVLVLFLAVLAGLLGGALLAVPLAQLPDWWGRAAPIAGALALVFLSLTMLWPHRRAAFGSAIAAARAETESDDGTYTPPILVDTSAIIDGRIADISQTGFILGTLVIPRFVLRELQHIADSPDVLRRNRGRRGLDMLNKLQKESVSAIEISDADVKEAGDVDTKLVRLAQTMHAPIITNDFNLNRVAELQGVPVLNINQLANAVKPVVLPGEEMQVEIIQEGKEYGQGVGYLEDGTMIVVDNGRRHINSTVDIVVTRVLQTVAGRMIFAQPKEFRGPNE